MASRKSKPIDIFQSDDEEKRVEDNRARSSKEQQIDRTENFNRVEDHVQKSKSKERFVDDLTGSNDSNGSNGSNGSNNSKKDKEISYEEKKEIATRQMFENDDKYLLLVVFTIFILVNLLPISSFVEKYISINKFPHGELLAKALIAALAVFLIMKLI